MKKWLYIVLTLALFVVAGCSNSKEKNDNAGVQEGGEVTFAMPSDVVSLDPQGTNDVPSEKVRDLIYEGLITQDENFEIVPQLATEWEQQDDTTYVFKLRDDVKFHSGKDFKAEDVKASLERATDIAVASPRSYILDMIEEVNIIDDYTVEIKTAYPFVPILNNLTHGAAKIMSKDMLDKDYQAAIDASGADISLEEYYELRDKGGDEYEKVAAQIAGDLKTVVETEPDGTGYAKFDSRNPGESTIVVKNSDYYDDQMNLDKVTFKVVTETGSRLAELESGQSQLISSVQSANIDRVESNPDVTLLRSETVSFDYIGFNTTKEPLNDKRVRQAITHAFNKQNVVDGVYNGAGTPASGPISPGVMGYSEELKGLEYDVEKAKALLKEAGLEDGFSLTMVVNDDNPERMDTALYLQEALKEINIDLKINQVEWGAYLEMTSAGEHEMLMLGWSNSTADPDNIITPLFTTKSHGASGNRAFYTNERVDELAEEARRENDEDKRREMYEEIQQLIIEDAPVISVRYTENLNARVNALQDIEIDRYDLFELKNAGLEQ
ncbi:glutathione ABC transporter substrate-binding protein [Phocicoccus schoeneichii]|uniref:glutathione ABC transporter substrate-binding protein n=1 Tax=Phocicoccus schoeneichii TaxID=1812261 RepID=UPI003D1303C3